MRLLMLSLCAGLAASPSMAMAEEEREPLRTRVYVGPQIVPASPGSGKLSFRPFVDVSRARGDDLFEFEAPDEPIGFSLVEGGGFELGPVLNFEGKRRQRHFDAPLHEVGFAVEPGAFAQYWISGQARIRVEARRAVTGHDGWVGQVSADYVLRDGNDWMLSIGPRLSLSDASYQQAYFGVTPADRAATGLALHSPDGGIHAVGITAGYLHQLDARWGIAAFARYDRLVGDAAQSPAVRQFGSRDQPSAGIALSYVFGRR